MKNRMVIIVTGTPGVGKTTISKLLASKLNAEIINMGDLIKREGLFIGVDGERDSLIADEGRLSKRIKEIIVGCKGTIIIEGHFAVHVTPPEMTDIVFVLRKDPEELKRTLEKRGFKGKKLWENIEAEILDVCLWDSISIHGKEKVCEIDVTERKPEETIEEIIQILRGERRCQVGIVDWLKEIERKGKIDEYLGKF